eukprot:scaffold26_cov117-Cylindrotheca_fusiformis.AAC.5
MSTSTRSTDQETIDPNTFFDMFGTFEVPDEPEADAQTATLENYDPFDIGTSPPKKASPQIKLQPPPLSKERPREQSKKAALKKASEVHSQAIPPLMAVNFKIHEEISSYATMDPDLEGSSEIFVQGGVLAQVTSSDALKNSPWVLLGTTKDGNIIDVVPNASYTTRYETRGDRDKVCIIKIPKSTVAFVPVGSYHFTETIEHMPLLLERRVTRKGDKVQVAIQVRSKLSNPYDLTDLSITLAFPDPVIEEDVEVNVGEGEFDKIKRSVTWRLSALQKGDSFMVSVRTVVNENTEDTSLQFPVLLRCSSLDQISTAEFKAVEANGFPATLSSEVSSSSELRTPNIDEGERAIKRLSRRRGDWKYYGCPSMLNCRNTMTYRSRGRPLWEVVLAICFVVFLVGFITVLCIGNYFRAKRAQERQRQRRLSKLAGQSGNASVAPSVYTNDGGMSYEAPSHVMPGGVQA